jgi:pyrroloquinoline quinone biosynthesis protein B
MKRDYTQQSRFPFLVSIQILGTAQDGGIPQLGCNCSNCELAYNDESYSRLVASIAIIGDSNTILIDATPDIVIQLNKLSECKGLSSMIPIDGVFITHLHLGHYIGLVQFGTEAAATKELAVYTTNEVKEFITVNKPFKYLNERKQISLHRLILNNEIFFDDFSINPFEVPHRNEDGNTIGLEVKNDKTGSTLLYIPDIDSLTKEIIQKIKFAEKIVFDGTFYSEDEIPRQKDVPHPPMMTTASILGYQDPEKFYFTHINHTNPANNPHSQETKVLKEMNYNIAFENMILTL